MIDTKRAVIVCDNCRVDRNDFAAVVDDGDQALCMDCFDKARTNHELVVVLPHQQKCMFRFTRGLGGGLLS